jgi:proline racemase
MRSKLVIQTVESHTEGMPTRVVTGGIAPVPGSTMMERRNHFRDHHDHVRQFLMNEPRGHASMSGAILQPPTRPDADWGVLFIEVSGYLPMCGHGTIGVATVLVETGMVPVTEPVTTVRLDTPAGLVTVDVQVEDGSAKAVTLRNVPAFSVGLDRAVTLADGREVRYDLAFGGNFYAITDLDALGLPFDWASRNDAAAKNGLIATGLAIMDAVNAEAEPVHPLDPSIRGLHHVYDRAGLGREALPPRHGHQPRLVRPVPLRHRHLRAHGPAPRPRRTRVGAGLPQRVVHRLPVHRPPPRRDRGRRAPGCHPVRHRPGLDHRYRPVHARSRRPLPQRLHPLSPPTYFDAQRLYH